MKENSEEIDLNKEFNWISEHADRVSKSIHDHLDNIEEGELNTIIKHVCTIEEKINQLDRKILECQNDIVELALEVSKLDETIKLATNR